MTNMGKRGCLSPLAAGRARRGAGPADRAQAGETLVELIITIAIVALVGVAVLGGLMTTLSASAQHRSLVTVDTLLKSYAESAKYQIELQPSPLYRDCATSYTVAWSPPSAYSSGYSVGIPAGGVVPWDATTEAFDTGSPAACSSGLQQITITATQLSTGIHDSMSIVVRNPTYQASDAGF